MAEADGHPLSNRKIKFFTTKVRKEHSAGSRIQKSRMEPQNTRNTRRAGRSMEAERCQKKVKPWAGDEATKPASGFDPFPHQPESREHSELDRLVKCKEGGGEPSRGAAGV